MLPDMMGHSTKSTWWRVVEDLHWADPTTLDVLRGIATIVVWGQGVVWYSGQFWALYFLQQVS
jgi:hypothetical protein